MKRLVCLVALCLELGGGVEAFAQTVVPTQTLRPGHVVSATDVVVSDTSSLGAYQSVSQVLGLEVQQVLYKGRPLRVGDVGAPALVNRNEIVTLIYETGTLSIATEGRALGRGSQGDRLRVLNLSSKNTVVGRVNPAGEVIVNHDRGRE